MVRPWLSKLKKAREESYLKSESAIVGSPEFKKVLDQINLLYGEKCLAMPGIDKNRFLIELFDGFNLDESKLVHKAYRPEIMT